MMMVRTLREQKVTEKIHLKMPLERVLGEGVRHGHDAGIAYEHVNGGMGGCERGSTRSNGRERVQLQMHKSRVALQPPQRLCGGRLVPSS